LQRNPRRRQAEHLQRSEPQRAGAAQARAHRGCPRLAGWPWRVRRWSRASPNTSLFLMLGLVLGTTLGAGAVAEPNSSNLASDPPPTSRWTFRSPSSRRRRGLPQASSEA
jgi:hypothetical protein